MKDYLELKSDSLTVQAPSPSAKEPSGEIASGVPVGNPATAVAQFKSRLGVISAFKVSCAEDKVRQKGAIAITEAHVEATVDVITTAIRSQQTELKGVLVANAVTALGAIATDIAVRNGVVQERLIEVGAEGAVRLAGLRQRIAHKIGQLAEEGKLTPEEAELQVARFTAWTIDTLDEQTRALIRAQKAVDTLSNSATNHLQNTIK
jgi:hypothetical protein